MTASRRIRQLPWKSLPFATWPWLPVNRRPPTCVLSGVAWRQGLTGLSGSAGHRTGSAPAIKNAYLPTLDGWRALAIGGVLFCHASESLVASGAYSAGSVASQLAAL